MTATATKPARATISRDEARDFYLRVFDEFAVIVSDEHDRNRGKAPIEDNSAFQPVVDAINARLDGTDRVGGQTIVRDWVNNDYEVWQCFQTHDSISHEQAEALFDAAWPTDEVEVPKAEPGAALRAVRDANCYCGCGAEVKTPKSIFAIGHDAKFAGNLIRSSRAGLISQDEAVAEAARISGALAAKVQRGVLRKITNRQAKRAAGVPQYREGIVKVGRWDYPARQYESGRIDVNSKRDGSGEWVSAQSGSQAERTFRKV